MRELLKRLLVEAFPKLRPKFTYQQRRYSYFRIGFGTYGSPNILMDYPNQAVLSIGKYCSIANDVWILLGAEHRIDWVTTYPFEQMFNGFGEVNSHRTKGNVTIGNDVWIGIGVLILSGVTVGDGAVLGAGTVISKDVSPYAVMVGNPARVIKYRFSPEVIEQLLKLKWWDWSLSKIKRNGNLLLSGDVEELMKL